MNRTLALLPLFLATLTAAHAQEVPFRTVGKGDGDYAVGPAVGGDFVIRSRAQLDELELGEFVHEEIAWGERFLIASVRDWLPGDRRHAVEITRVEQAEGPPRLVVMVEAWEVPASGALRPGERPRGAVRPVHIVEVAADAALPVEFRSRPVQVPAQRDPQTREPSPAQARPPTRIPFRTVGRGDGADAVGPPEGGDFVIRSREQLEQLDLAEFVHEEIAWSERFLLASFRDALPGDGRHTVEIKRVVLVERFAAAPRLVVFVETTQHARGAERPVHIVEVAVDPAVEVVFRARSRRTRDEPQAQAEAQQRAEAQQAPPVSGRAEGAAQRLAPAARAADK